MKQLRLGVVGTGHMGQHHARVYQEMPDVELTAIADIDELTLLEISRRMGVNSYLDYRELFDKVDAVNIVVPTTLHYEMSKAFLEHGIHVLVEKPVTRTVVEAEKLNKLAKAKNLVFQVGHTERFNPGVQEIYNFVEDPIFVEANRLGPSSQRNLDIGVVLELMIHDLDIILSLVNSKIKKVHAMGVSVYSDYEDIAIAQLLFENGCLASLASSRVTAEKIRKLEVTLEDAFLCLDYIDQNITLRRQISARYVFDKKKSTRYQREFLLEKPFVSKDEPLKLELAHFIKCIKYGEKPLISGEEALEALKVAEDILENMVITNIHRDSFSAIDLNKLNFPRIDK